MCFRWQFRASPSLERLYLPNTTSHFIFFSSHIHRHLARITSPSAIDGGGKYFFPTRNDPSYFRWLPLFPRGPVTLSREVLIDFAAVCFSCFCHFLRGENGMTARSTHHQRIQRESLYHFAGLLLSTFLISFFSLSPHFFFLPTLLSPFPPLYII